MAQHKDRMTNRVRKNILSVASITVILAVLLGIAYPIAANGSEKARDITLIVWGCIAALSYLAYLIYAIYEYKTNYLDMHRTPAQQEKAKRKKLLKERKSEAKKKGIKLTAEEKEDILSGKVDPNADQEWLWK